MLFNNKYYKATLANKYYLRVFMLKYWINAIKSIEY